MREPQYCVPTKDLHLGGTFTNENILIRLLRDGTVAGLWCAQDDQTYCGEWRVDFLVDGCRAEPELTEFAPTFQRTTYRAGGVAITKTVFVPHGGDRMNIVFVVAEAHNHGQQPANLRLICELKFREVAWTQYVKAPDFAQLRKRVRLEQHGNVIVIHREDLPSEVRVMNTGNLPLLACMADDRHARIHLGEVELPSGQTHTVPLALAISPLGKEDALRTLELVNDHARVFRENQSAMVEDLRRAHIVTPDPLLNRAIVWAKINSLRQDTKYSAGYGFTNDPPQDVLVVRDASWFIAGADYFMPEFSRAMLQVIQHHGIEPGGKLTEYLLLACNPPVKNDYDMNINDNTPLFIIAAHHHCALSQDPEFWRTIYPTVKRAAEWILFQRTEDGLVYSTSEEANVWGICGWRNIIPGYSLNGAVTEVNSECYRALVCAAALAEAVDDNASTRRFSDAADRMKDAINNRLKSEKTGFYLLNLDTEGVAHHDLTGDMVFPVMFGVAGKDTARRILDVLYTPMFWTRFGVRTVAQGEWNYDPEFGARLVGGIWGNLTAWVAYANRALYPERMVEAMRNLYRISEVECPREYHNVAPGEFPECLHGENFQSRGMALSPWLPPTYLWVAVEGVLGVAPSLNGLTVNPHLPREWRWVMGQNLRYASGSISFFLYHEKLFSTVAVNTRFPLERFDADVTAQLDIRYPPGAPSAGLVALRKEGKTVVFIGADEDTQVALRVPKEIGCGQDREISLKLGAGEGRLFEFPRDS